MSTADWHRLASGGFSTVYRIPSQCKNPSVKWQAVKLYSSKEISFNSTLLKLRHLNLVESHQWLHYGNHQLGLLMEFCSRGDLYQFLQSRLHSVHGSSSSASASASSASASSCMNSLPLVSEAECRFILWQVVAGVAYLHQLNWVHRDLKLSNLLLTEDYTVKIGDFDLACCLTDTTECSRENDFKSCCGTPNYMAPEQLSKNNRDRVGKEADLWSVGCMIYTLLVGRPPFEEPNNIQKTLERVWKGEYWLPGPQDRPSMSQEARDLIRRLLVRDPRQRITLTEILQHPFLQLPVEPLSEHGVRTIPAGLVDSAAVGKTEHQKELEPFTTVRLKPIQQKTKHGILSILTDGHVQLALSQDPYTMDFSPDGERIAFYANTSNPSSSTSTPSASTTAAPRRFLHEFTRANLPPKYHKKYRYAARFVHLLRSKRVHLVLHHFRLGRCLFMENGVMPDFCVSECQLEMVGEEEDGVLLSFGGRDRGNGSGKEGLARQGRWRVDVSWTAGTLDFRSLEETPHSAPPVVHVVLPVQLHDPQLIHIQLALPGLSALKLKLLQSVPSRFHALLQSIFVAYAFYLDTIRKGQETGQDWIYPIVVRYTTDDVQRTSPLPVSSRDDQKQERRAPSAVNAVIHHEHRDEDVISQVSFAPSRFAPSLPPTELSSPTAHNRSSITSLANAHSSGYTSKGTVQAPPRNASSPTPSITTNVTAAATRSSSMDALTSPLSSWRRPPVSTSGHPTLTSSSSSHLQRSGGDNALLKANGESKESGATSVLPSQSRGTRSLPRIVHPSTSSTAISTPTSGVTRTSPRSILPPVTSLLSDASSRPRVDAPSVLVTSSTPVPPIPTSILQPMYRHLPNIGWAIQQTVHANDEQQQQIILLFEDGVQLVIDVPSASEERENQPPSLSKQANPSKNSNPSSGCFVHFTHHHPSASSSSSSPTSGGRSTTSTPSHSSPLPPSGTYPLNKQLPSFIKQKLALVPQFLSLFREEGS